MAKMVHTFRVWIIRTDRALKGFFVFEDSGLVEERGASERAWSVALEYHR